MSEPKKIRRLSKLSASEVSLVNRGAIRRPFLVIKNQEGSTMEGQQAPVVPQLSGDHEAKFAALAAKFGQVVKADDGGVAESEGLDERAMAALKAVYRILLPFKGQIPEDAVDDVLAELDLDDTGDDAQDDATEEVNEDDQGSDPEPEEESAMAKDFDPEDLKKAADWSPSQSDGTSDADHVKAVQAAKDAYAKAIGKAADDDDEDEDEDDDNVSKSAVKKAALPPLSKEHLHLIAKAEAGRAEEVRKREALEQRIAKMEGDAELRNIEDSLKADCQVLGKDVSEQARIVKSLSGSKEACDAYVAMLRESANATHKSGVFKSVGTSTNAAFGGRAVPNSQGTPQQRFDAMVRGVVEKNEAVDEMSATMKVLATAAGQEAYNQIHGGRN